MRGEGRVGDQTGGTWVEGGGRGGGGRGREEESTSPSLSPTGWYQCFRT